MNAINKAHVREDYEAIIEHYGWWSFVQDFPHAVNAMVRGLQDVRYQQEPEPVHVFDEIRDIADSYDQLDWY